MRVTFERLPDFVRGHTVIERDDGVVYHLGGLYGRPELPHDLVHYTVEDALDMPDGIWGAIAGGVVFGSMTHVSGRRPPHAAGKSKDLIREHRDLLQRAEHLGGICERAAGTGEDVAERLRPAVTALHTMAARWSALAVGETLGLHWPRYRTIRSAAPTPGPTARPGRPRSRRGRTSARPTS